MDEMEKLVQELKARGFCLEDIQFALSLYNEGRPPDEIREFYKILKPTYAIGGETHIADLEDPFVVLEREDDEEESC